MNSIKLGRFKFRGSWTGPEITPSKLNLVSHLIFLVKWINPIACFYSISLLVTWWMFGSHFESGWFPFDIISSIFFSSFVCLLLWRWWRGCFELCCICCVPCCLYWCNSDWLIVVYIFIVISLVIVSSKGFLVTWTLTPVYSMSLTK